MRLSALCALALTVSAQSFDVVSIRPNRSGGTDSNLDSLPGGRMTATNITVRELIRLAYSVKDYQIEHAPGWMDTERYDIAATGLPAGKARLEDEQARIRVLLEDRCRLKTHRETKPGRVYLLIVANGGPTLTPHNDGTGTKTRKGCGHLAGSRVTVDVIATMLSREAERDVLNHTGLAGKFDFQLDWTPDVRTCPTDDDASARPSFYTAVQQQLGLKLEGAKAPVEVLIIDRIEHPTPN
jgi:uncharacterized protein (TIGR03435 family)